MVPDRRVRRSTGQLAPALAASAFGALASLTACGGDGTGPSAGPKVRVVAGAHASDTAFSLLAQPLIVEVRDSAGGPLAGAVVRFEGAPPADPTRADERAVVLCPAAAPCATFDYGPTSVAVDTTGGDGRAEAAVRLGSVAGPAKVYVTVPSRRLRDSVMYTVLPGQPVDVAVTLADTMVRVGGSYAVGAATIDQFRNRRADPITYSADGVVASVSASGTVKGLSLGRGTITAHSGVLKGFAFVSVVPPGHLAVYERSRVYPQPSGIVELDLDGANLRLRKTTADLATALPAWSPDGTRIMYTDTSSSSTGPSRPQLYELNAQDAALPAVNDASVERSEQGEYSRDGAYRYFAGASAEHAGVWRIRTVAGSSAEFLAGTEGGAYPSPSPDGARIVFVDSASVLNVLTIATGAVRSLGVLGTVPRWSPSGESIAFFTDTYSGELDVINADGSGRRALAYELSYSAEWSPDGRWLATSSYFGDLSLVRVADGQVLPLAVKGGRQFFSPAWKP